MSSKEVFKKFVPPEAVDYCNQLYETLNFEFKIKRGRLTKLGDYRFVRKDEHHIISINNDLNPYAFLITYIHEVAHLVTFQKYKGKVAPHGKEWKQNFTDLAQPLLTNQIFPNEILVVLVRYFKNPKASSCSDPTLFKTLKLYDPPSDRLSLDEIPIGSKFEFNKRIFNKIEKKRTRWVCSEISQKRLYLIPGVVDVQLINE